MATYFVSRSGRRCARPKGFKDGLDKKPDTPPIDSPLTPVKQTRRSLRLERKRTRQSVLVSKEDASYLVDDSDDDQTLSPTKSPVSSPKCRSATQREGRPKRLKLAEPTKAQVRVFERRASRAVGHLLPTGQYTLRVGLTPSCHVGELITNWTPPLPMPPVLKLDVPEPIVTLPRARLNLPDNPRAYNVQRALAVYRGRLARAMDHRDKLQVYVDALHAEICNLEHVIVQGLECQAGQDPLSFIFA